MKIDSLAFMVFLPLALILYRVFPAKLRWFILLVCSYVFIGIYNPILALAVFGVTLITYWCARKIEFAVEKSTRRFYLILTVIVSIGSLFACKYLNFFAGQIIDFLAIFGLGIQSFTLDLIVPIGISFFTLRAVAYVADVYNKKHNPEKHFGYYALYLSFFPTLPAGPIERPHEFMEHLKAKKPFAGYNGARGMKLLAVGFFKIAVVARQVSAYVDIVYSSVGSLNTTLMNGFTVLLATVFFAVQIYCDFSGYCDIAAGCSAIMGIRISDSYISPYFAKGIKNFLERWNVTVNAWFKEYVYLPLLGESTSAIRKYASLVITFVLGGLWYGAGWTFVLLGVIACALFILSDVLVPIRGRLFKSIGINPDGKLVGGAKRIWTAFMALVFVMLIRAEDVKSFGRLFGTLFGGWRGISFMASLTSVGMSLLSLITVLLSVYCVVLLDRQISCKKDDPRLNDAVRVERIQTYVVLGWTIAVAFLMLLMSDGVNAYQYFVF